MTDPIRSVDPAAEGRSAPPTKGVVLHKAATVYDLLSPPMLFWQEQRVNRHAVRWLDPAPSASVLDLGCATGKLALTVAARLDGAAGGQVVGLDASPEMIAVARRKVAPCPCRFDLGVAESLPYPDASFDGVVSSFFFHHLNLVDKLTALREVKRVLKPGGVLVVADLDKPTGLLGWMLVWGSAALFRQSEIVENARGLLPGLFVEAGFESIRRCDQHLGVVSIFRMERQRA